MTDGAGELPRAKGAVAKPRRRARPVRWSARREEKFLATLAEMSNVAASARAAGISESSVYRHRQRSDEFRARWAAALREGYSKLETLLLERALNGVERPVWHGGRQVGTAREYSDRLALALLAAHRTSVTGAAPGAAPALSDTEVHEELVRRLSEMNVRMGGEG